METPPGRTEAARQRRLKAIAHAPEHAWFCPCAPGLEPWLLEELRALGAIAPQATPGGVEFRGKLSVGYAVNLHARLANRVLLRVATFGARRPEELFKRARALPWDVLLGPLPLEFRLTSHASWLHHDELVARTLREAISQQRAGEGLPPLPADGETVQRVFVRLEADRATISLDSSGEHLHRRGYRQAIGRAPLRETMAAAALRVAGYQGQEPLLDPMCGSGTLVIEAAEIALLLAPGRQRRFTFEFWPSFKEATWRHLCRQARASGLDRPPHGIWGRDQASGALAAAQANADRAGVQHAVCLEQLDFFEAPPPADTGLVVANPPYGVRLEARHQGEELFVKLGRRLRQAYAGWRFALFVPSAEVPALGLAPERVLRLPHGGLDVSLAVGTLRA